MAEKTDKRYYFIKLPMDFFSDKVIKALKSKPNGDTYVVIALKLLLFGLSMDNVLQFDELEPTFAEELAVSIDENPEDVATVMDILLKAKWLVQESDTVIQSVKGEELTEAIAESTLRVRKLRSLRKQKELTSSYQDISEQLPEENDEERYIDVSSPLHERFNSVSSRSYSGNGETDAKRIGNIEIDIRDRDRERDRARDRDINVLSSEKKQSKEKFSTFPKASPTPKSQAMQSLANLPQQRAHALLNLLSRRWRRIAGKDATAYRQKRSWRSTKATAGRSGVTR